MSAPVVLRATPGWVRDACGGFAATLRRLCPSAIPAGEDAKLIMSLVFASRRNPFNLLELGSGNESLGDQQRNRPPQLVGVLLVSGNLGRGLSGLLPRTGATPTGVRDGLANRSRREPLSLGRRHWAGHQGELALAPTEGPVPLAYFRYLFYRWQDADGAHALGLRAWEPFSETVRVLHALVGRLGPAPVKRFAYPASSVVSGRIAMARTPDWLVAACRALRTRPICPRQVPAARADLVDVFFEPDTPGPNGGQDWISAEWGTPYGDTANNRPPNFVHLDFKAGAAAPDRSFARLPTAPRDGLFRTRSAGPLPLGSYRWAGHSGALVLGDCFGNHLCFRWREQGLGYQIDLHGWEPFTQTVAALHAVVTSTP